MTKIARTADLAYRIGRILHWVTAIFFMVLLLSTDIAREIVSNSAERRELYYWHMSFGLIFLYLLTFRIGWVVIFPETRTQFAFRWQAISARINHFLLYTLMIAMPISGFLFTLADGDEIPLLKLFILQPGEWLLSEDLGYYGKEAHIYLTWAAYGLMTLHAAGALTHWWGKKRKAKQLKQQDAAPV